MSSQGSLRGKVALVTGAGRRLGRAIAERLGAEGMDVVLHCHGSRAGAEEARQNIARAGGHALVIEADLGVASDRARLVLESLGAFGGLDLVVPSAANFDRVEFAAWTEEHWRRAMSVNLEAPVSLVRDLAPALAQRRGSAVLITDAALAHPHKHYFPYLVSKAALSYAVRVMAAELAPNVRVNAVAPGIVLAPEDLSPSEKTALLAAVPLDGEGAERGEGGAAVIADAVVYLAGAEFVTGTEMVVDGGRSLRG